ncbi:MAG: hypothetical protein H7123_04430 [Thermoleophilia bacterium]|nr:hypothetical protein [Thermoleophilia bacterium]
MNTVVAWVTVIVIALSLTALYAATLKYGPRRGYWNQPAARLRAPGRQLVIALWIFAALHAVAGLAMMVFSDTYGLSVFIVSLLMGGFYGAMAMVMQIATIAQRKQPGAVETVATWRRRSKNDVDRSDD